MCLSAYFGKAYRILDLQDHTKTASTLYISRRVSKVETVPSKICAKNHADYSYLTNLSCKLLKHGSDMPCALLKREYVLPVGALAVDLSVSC